jgi:hypothetical protein
MKKKKEKRIEIIRTKKETVAFHFDSHLYKEIIVITLDIYGFLVITINQSLLFFFFSVFDICRIFGVYGQ